MKAHELAKLLLERPDSDVKVECYDFFGNLTIVEMKPADLNYYENSDTWWIIL